MSDEAVDKIQLRAERDGDDRRYLWAWIDEEGNLRIEGQDLGPGTRMVSSDGEYEWWEMIEARRLPELVRLLGGNDGDDVLELLAARYTGRGSYELERILREHDLISERQVWSG